MPVLGTTRGRIQARDELPFELQVISMYRQESSYTLWYNISLKPLPHKKKPRHTQSLNVGIMIRKTLPCGTAKSPAYTGKTKTASRKKINITKQKKRPSTHKATWFTTCCISIFFQILFSFLPSNSNSTLTPSDLFGFHTLLVIFDECQSGHLYCILEFNYTPLLRTKLSCQKPLCQTAIKNKINYGLLGRRFNLCCYSTSIFLL